MLSADLLKQFNDAWIAESRPHVVWKYKRLDDVTIWMINILTLLQEIRSAALGIVLSMGRLELLAQPVCRYGWDPDAYRLWTQDGGDAGRTAYASGSDGRKRPGKGD